MPQLKLNKLLITHFKGIDNFELVLDGDNAVITAENGIGKTTVYDAFLWLLFGKDSTGRKDFEVRPLDRRNQPIKGLVLSVVAELGIDGINHVFRKEHHEKVVKEQLRGYETLCWIDEVPKKVSEFAEYIEELISEETFKLLTDLHFFNSKMHWTDRRKVLLDIAGEIGTPDGFDELLAALNGRTVDEYKKVLSEQKKRYVKERDEINPRIDEILKGLEHPASNVVGLEAHRIDIQAEISALNIRRQDIVSTETMRAKKQGMVNLLTKQKIAREGELATDTSGVDTLLEEKNQINIAVGDVRALASTAEAELKVAKNKLTATNDETTSLLSDLNLVRKEIKKIDTDDCPRCGQKWPIGLEKPEKRVLVDRCNDLKAKVDHNTNLIVALNGTTKQLTDALEKTKIDLVEGQEYAEKRLAEIDEAIKTRPTPPSEQDEQWKKIVTEIAKVEAEIGPPVAEQLEAIESQRITKEAELTKLNEELVQADRMVKDRARIQELEAKEKDLAQKIADVEKQLADIERYKATQSTLITTAVNTKFKAVKFKMFKELLNGGLEECCEATYMGVPYPDMSSGQKIYCGIDIVNVLSEHYGVSVPMFIDHSESMTLPIEANSQTIELFAKKGVKELQVQTTKKVEKAVA